MPIPHTSLVPSPGFFSLMNLRSAEMELSISCTELTVMVMRILSPHAARWARSVKLLAPGEGNGIWRNPQVAHVRHVDHIRITRVNLHGITIAIAHG